MNVFEFIPPVGKLFTGTRQNVFIEHVTRRFSHSYTRKNGGKFQLEIK